MFAIEHAKDKNRKFYRRERSCWSMQTIYSHSPNYQLQLFGQNPHIHEHFGIVQSSFDQYKNDCTLHIEIERTSDCCLCL